MFIYISIRRGVLVSSKMFCVKCGNIINECRNFCSSCGTKKKSSTSSLPDTQFSGERECISQYFYAGYKYGTICEFLDTYHDISISERTLKRRLASYGLQRNCGYPSHIARNLIEQEINSGPPSQYGYRNMHHHLRTKFHAIVPRDTVMNLLKEIDPVGTAERKSHRLKRRQFVSPGPNHSWHIDGYDKLKPYGFPIHGCVDGFSRRIIWLKVAR